MSAPKADRKTPRPKLARTYAHTEARRQKILAILTESIGQPVTNLRDQLGVDKVTLHSAITWLQEEGHTIIPLARGYMLLDSTPLEQRMLKEISDLKCVVAKLATILEAVVPGAVPVPVSRNKPVARAGAPKSSYLDIDTAPLIAAIAKARNQGRPFTKTGRPGSNGIYARREELPAPFNAFGRDRLEGLVQEMT